MIRAVVFAVIISLSFLVFVVSSIRHRKLHEGFAVMWIAVSVFMLLASATLPFHVLAHLASVLGIAYPPDLLLLLAVVFLLMLVLKLSSTVSLLSARVTTLAQEVALDHLRPGIDVETDSTLLDGKD